MFPFWETFNRVIDNTILNFVIKLFAIIVVQTCFFLLEKSSLITFQKRVLENPFIAGIELWDYIIKYFNASC